MTKVINGDMGGEQSKVWHFHCDIIFEKTMLNVKNQKVQKIVFWKENLNFMIIKIESNSNYRHS